MIDWLDNIWKWAGQHPIAVFLGALFIGITLCLLSFVIGVDHVTFKGQVGTGMITGIDHGFSKQVGFILAPNWGIASFVLIPAIAFFLCNARGGIEDILAQLARDTMVRRSDGQPIDPAVLLAHWQAFSRWWILLWPAIFFLVFLIVMVLDFYPVVFDWLWNRDVASQRVAGIQLNHSSYEFDWSIAAFFPDSGVKPVPNILFSLAAYLWVPLFASSAIIAAIFWFLSVAAFLGQYNLRKLGIAFVPNIESSDRRCGMEILEPLFSSLLIAALLTALMALGMHLQNVFLRAPEFQYLHDMVFGSMISSIKANVEMRQWPLIIEQLMTVGEALRLDSDDGYNIQFLVTGLGLFLISMLVAALMSGWLFLAAARGRNLLLGELRGKGNADRRQRSLIKSRLGKMRPWPVPYLSIWIFMTYLGLTAISMVYVNVLSVVIIALAGKGIFQVMGNTIQSLTHKESDEEDDEGPDTTQPGAEPEIGGSDAALTPPVAAVIPDTPPPDEKQS